MTLVPGNFPSIILDLVGELTVTFPEYSSLWCMYNENTTSEKWTELFEYCLTVYPERFFDILYQNQDIFTNSVNTMFLPQVEFKYLFSCQGVTENIQKSLWKHIQVVLFTIMGNMKDKSEFGNIFDGMDESELQTKLKDAMAGMSDFFKTMETPEPNAFFENMFDRKTDSEPNPDDMHAHMKHLFGEKLGNIAIELIDELTDDLKQLFEINPKDFDDKFSPSDLFKKLMQHPDKFMKVMQKVSAKFQEKMKKGDLSQEEVMKEAGEILRKMKEMGGNTKEMQEMFQTMSQSMGGMKDMFKKDTNPKISKKKTFSIESSAPNQYVYKSTDGPMLKTIVKQDMTSQELDALVLEIETPSKKKKSKKSNGQPQLK